MSASKNYRPHKCTCGSGKLAEPQTINGVIVCFACIMCADSKLVVWKPEILSDPNFFSLLEDDSKQKL